MRVQFVWPNFDCPLGPSMGQAYLSGALKAAGHQTNILHISEWLDYPFQIDRVSSDVKNFRPDMIAMSTGANHYPETRRLLERLKKDLDVPIILGGIHATLNAPAVMGDNPFIDFVGVGEGDDAIVELAAAVEKGGDTTNIGNVWARGSGGAVKPNAPRRLKDITKIPWMDLEGWPQFPRITELRRGWVNVYMNRGCPYRCTYCHNNGVAKLLEKGFGAKNGSNEALGYLRLRGIDDMLGELKSIMSKFSVTAFSFNDDTFTMDQPYMKEFLARYKKEINVPFVCNTTVLDVDNEMLDVMKESGCDLVRFGVETATVRIKRQILKRDFSNDKTEEVFKYCRKIGLRSFAFNILANPGETREEMRETLKLNAKLLPNGLKVSLGYPFPGTEYHDIAKSLDLIDESKHFHNFLHDTKLKFSPEDRLWIDKVRCCFWWWMNVDLDNEASAIYRELVKMVEAFSVDEWMDPEMERRIWNLDDATSKVLQMRGITHYTIPFKDRPEISILHQGTDLTLRQEVLDPH